MAEANFNLMRWIVKASFNLLIWAAYASYRAEGINSLLLLMPASLIAPTLRKFGASIGERVEMHSPLIVHNASAESDKHYSNLVIGDDCYFGRDVFFDLKDQLVFEDCVTVSMRATFITHTDVGKSPLAHQLPPTHESILLRRGAYIGAGVTILQGVEVGESAVIAAGAIVDESVPESTVYGGVPAREIRRYVRSSG